MRAILNKAKRNLGSITRHAKIFRNTTTLRVLYYALVRSHIDFGGVVWDASSEITMQNTRKDSENLPAVFALQELVVFRQYYEYFIHRELNATPRPVRNPIAIHDTFLLVHGLVHGKINSPYLLSMLNIKVPARRARVWK